MHTSSDILDDSGLLKKAIPGFTPRLPQQQMAQAIERAIELNAQLIVEAGTGTGKTFAYLVPAFLSQKKTIISTGTKNLQDQLFFKDVPVIKKILPHPLKVVLLKGRANYLCLYRLKESREDGRFSSRQLITQLHIVDEWSRSTQEGDIAELITIPEDSAIWPYVTSTVDNCLNQECEFFKECHVAKARSQALAADVVIVNHHLFFADMVLQEEGFGELLPGAEVIIFDEAHHLPDIASHFFSTVLTGRQLTELARDTEIESLKSAKDMVQLLEIAGQLQLAVQEMRASFGEPLCRAPWPSRLAENIQTAVKGVKEKLQSLEAILKIVGVRSKELENCWRRASKLIERFNLLTGTTPENNIHWFETHLQSFSLQLTPMVVAEFFQAYMAQHKRAWIFTSATLTVKNSFQLFINTLGVNKALQLQLKSPFDYQTQALLYVPRGLPDTHAQNYTEKLIEAVVPILEATQGKAFFVIYQLSGIRSSGGIVERANFFSFIATRKHAKERVD